MKTSVKALLLTSFFLVMVCQLPVSAEYNTVTGRDEAIYISTEQEVAMGDSVAKQLERAYKLVGDKYMQKRVELIGNRLVQYCDRKELIYHFAVIDIDDINAVSLPGGWVYVFKGLVDKCKNDDELAGVIAHEIGHIAARHHIKKMQQSSLANLAMILVGTTQGGDAANATNLALTSLMMAYSREDEFEADRRAVIYTKAANYDPKGIITFMQTMKEAKKFDINPYSYFKSHPYIGERIGVVESEISGGLTFREWINRPLEGKW